MGIRKIAVDEAPALRKKCRFVTSFDNKLWDLLDDMKDTMYKADGVGLAAPQVSIIKRIVVIDVGEGIIELVNPVIEKTSGEQTGREGCLSLPGRAGIVTRPNKVKVKAQNRFGDWYEIEGEGLLARALCHEIDHLDGILYIDKMEREATEDDE